jgi:hypothetical protein
MARAPGRVRQGSGIGAVGKQVSSLPGWSRCVSSVRHRRLAHHPRGCPARSRKGDRGACRTAEGRRPATGGPRLGRLTPPCRGGSNLLRSEGGQRSSPVETNNLPIRAWLALRPCGCGHLGVMGRGRTAWAENKPQTLGHHSNSFRCRWIDLAAVSAEEGPCHQIAWRIGTGSDYVGRWGTDGVAFLRWSAICAGSTHAASLYTALIPLYVATLAAVVLGEAFTPC